MDTIATNVRVEHTQVVHWVRTTRACQAARAGRGAAAETGTLSPSRARRTAQQYTLLELIQAIADVTNDEREIVATVVHLLASGQVRLCGNFRDEPIELFLAS